MRVAIQYAVAAVAAVLALLLLPSAVQSVSMIFSALPPLMLGFGFVPFAEWLWVVLWIGLALVEPRVPAKVLFILAAVLQLVVNASSFVGLMQFVFMARLAPDRVGSVTGMPAWAYYLPLLAASVALSMSSGALRRVALWAWTALAFSVAGALVPSQLSSDGSVTLGFWDLLLRAGYDLASLALLGAIAFVVFSLARGGALVEQALRADAAS